VPDRSLTLTVKYLQVVHIVQNYFQAEKRGSVTGYVIELVGRHCIDVDSNLKPHGEN
jgi:hypothetical protein